MQSRMEPSYLENRLPDFQYQDHLKMILSNGIKTQHPNQPIGRIVNLHLPLFIFDLTNGFPLVTERFMPFSKTLSPISEMLAFINGVRDQKTLQEWGVKWWNTWTTKEKCSIFGLETGDLGPGSYGAGFNFPRFEFDNSSGIWTAHPFNQFDHLIREIIHKPSLSTHKISCWIPQLCLQHEQLQRKVVVAPCHGDIQVTILDNKLYLRMDERSGDYPVGVPADIMMYGALTIMLGHLTGFEPKELIISVHDAHIYENQIPYVHKILSRKPKRFPLLHLTEAGKKVTSIFDFKTHHFSLTQYEYHPAIPEMPVTE